MDRGVITAEQDAWFPDDQHGYSIALCRCEGGAYLGARKAGTPCCCERCGFMTQDQFDFLAAALLAERDALAAAVDRIRRRHPRGDEESGYLAPGLWCPTCGRERADNGYGGCPDRQALIIPGQPMRVTPPEATR